jgi:hypothetical protein
VIYFNQDKGKEQRKLKGEKIMTKREIIEAMKDYNDNDEIYIIKEVQDPPTGHVYTVYIPFDYEVTNKDKE